MLLRFTKMQGLGNDFVVLDLVTQRFNLQAEHVRKLADRHFGIGCDQLLVVETPMQPDVDFRYRIYNGDGNEVEQCGNGARCFAKFVRDKKLTGKNKIRVETNSGIIELSVMEDRQIRVNMGKPLLEPADIPFTASNRANTYTLLVDDQEVSISAVSIGNPHAIITVEDIDTAPVSTLGPAIECHTDFPQRVNVGFMQVVSRKEINLRVFERGAGETLACGSGACAAMVSGQLQGLLDQQITANLSGGSLTLEWRGEGHPVMMTGPASNVFEGQITL
jgi:diaminopimelate epimerase